MKRTVGEVLITLLERRGVDMVFGIPGVHTVELYRGLRESRIRHITPRHELSAGFMADGYARATGKPGVCLLITGPGVSNAITAMAQARADSVPMLVISGVNTARTHGHEEGYLHELPDQMGMMRTVALYTHTLHDGRDLERVVDRAFAAMTAGRPGPVHLDIPLDVMSQMIELPAPRAPTTAIRLPDPAALAVAGAQLHAAERPLILAGGGAARAGAELRALAEALDAPVISTVNARALLPDHPLHVPATASLPAVRDGIAAADVVLAVGTQFGTTDYDIYIDHGFPDLPHLIRVDCDPVQATRGRLADQVIVADAKAALEGLRAEIASRKATDGATRAAAMRSAAFDSLSAEYKAGVEVLKTIADSLPGAVMVGDSTQLVYAGNMYVEVGAGGGWFNSSVGYGALGYGAPAAIGAQLGQPESTVVCLTGDGGFQFCLAELGTAKDEGAPVIFLVWNNDGYHEIESYMIENEIAPIGVRPSPPNFVTLADAYGIGAEAIEGTQDLAGALTRAKAAGGPRLIEVIVTE